MLFLRGAGSQSGRGSSKSLMATATLAIENVMRHPTSRMAAVRCSCKLQLPSNPKGWHIQSAITKHEHDEIKTADKAMIANRAWWNRLEDAISVFFCLE